MILRNWRIAYVSYLCLVCRYGSGSISISIFDMDRRIRKDEYRIVLSNGLGESQLTRKILTAGSVD